MTPTNSEKLDSWLEVSSERYRQVWLAMRFAMPLKLRAAALRARIEPKE